jgi:DNA-binding response OmpR family regulator
MADATIRVLLVEDNPGDARLVQEALAEWNSPSFCVTHVDRLSTARRALAEDDFDVVLLDLALPDKPRMGSLVEIHDQALRLPVLVLTGLDDETFATWALEEGAEDYLVKGRTDTETLVRSIRYAIQRHRAQLSRLVRAPARFGDRS